MRRFTINSVFFILENRFLDIKKLIFDIKKSIPFLDTKKIGVFFFFKCNKSGTNSVFIPEKKNQSPFLISKNQFLKYIIFKNGGQRSRVPNYYLMTRIEKSRLIHHTYTKYDSPVSYGKINRGHVKVFQM